MSPALEMPLNRREAMSSLLAMLAFVMGVSETNAAVVPSDAVEPADPVEQPLPSSHAVWNTSIQFFAHTEDLPIPRNLEIEGALTFDGTTLRLDVWQDADPVWIDGVEQPVRPLGSFLYLDEPAPLLDTLSEEADAAWRKRRLAWAERPFDCCPTCLTAIDKRPTCTACGGTGWIHFTADEGFAMVQQERAERRALIEAAVAAAR